MDSLSKAVASALALVVDGNGDERPIYRKRAPRDAPMPYGVWTIDTSGVSDTGSALHDVALTVDIYARDSATESGAVIAADFAADLDAIMNRAHITSADGSSSLVVRDSRNDYQDPEDEAVTWLRCVYTWQWLTSG